MSSTCAPLEKSDPDRPGVWKWICLLVFFLGLAYLTLKVYQIAFLTPVDFKYIWLAGDIWSGNASPYTSLFAELGQRYFEGGSIPKNWVYPPNWYFFSVAIATLPLPAAAVIWLGLNCIFFGTTAFLLVKALQKSGRAFDYTSFFAVFGFLALLQATPMTLSLGQTSLLIGFGVSLIFVGVSTGRKILVSLGLVILMLKPQYGLVFSLYLFLNREYRIAVLGAAAVVTISMIPALLAGGAVETISDFLKNISSYRTYNPNLPQNMTGVRNLIYLVLRKDVPSIFLLAAALGFAGTLAWFLNSRKHLWDTNAEKTKTGLLLLSAAIFVIIPFHTYDLVLIAPVVAYSITRGHLSLLMIAGFALIFRSGNLADVTGLHDPLNSIFPGSLLSTIGIGMIFTDLAQHYKRLLK